MLKQKSFYEFLRDECEKTDLVDYIARNEDFLSKFNLQCLRKSSDESDRLIYSDVRSKIVFDLKMKEGKFTNFIKNNT